MKISEKAAYIKGLAEGLKLDVSKPEGRVLNEVVNLLDELAGVNNSLVEENIKLRDYIEEIDADLGELERYVFDIDDEDCDCGDCDCGDCDGDCDCGDGCDCDFEDENEFDDDDNEI